jgi:hypothetical protein
MPLLYETYGYPQTHRHFQRSLQITRKTYRVEFPDRIPEGTSRGTGKITWDPNKTKVDAAYLEVTGVMHLWGATIIWFVRGGIEAFVNGISLEGYLSPICTWDCEYPFSFQKDCTGIIKNGENIVELKVFKSFGWPTGVEVKNMSVFIHVDYEGEPPEVIIKPPPPEWWPYVKWGAIGAGAIAGVFLVLKAVEVARKPKG